MLKYQSAKTFMLCKTNRYKATVLHNMNEHTTTHYNKLQHTATHYNTLQQTSFFSNVLFLHLRM